MSVVPDYLYQGSMIPFRYRFEIHVWNPKGDLIDYSEREIYNEKGGHNLEAAY
ncbi:hypothetical protein BX285_4655 [Streptomyces sp. 1114.5]|uniref:hypothetical protein n=1 Tax=Streptomyces sp. 1114.5 TaxID=1938830 RepID=UPI000F0EE536|nr:hypothetical protein [Streptomyces sp. 1114.5]RKT20174.1 hypothetical protein BX285_4655 [Streptomyces sp. 1114.5]